MARSDLLITLVKASMGGDKNAVRSTVEEIISEESRKQHTVLADRLRRVIEVNGRMMTSPSQNHAVDQNYRGREFLVEITPQKRLEDLVLNESLAKAISTLIE